MVPCIDDNIPVYVRNIFNPSFEGTVIEGRSDTLAASWGKVEDDEDAALIKGITSIDDASLLTLEGASLAGGASEVGEKVLAAMSNAKVSVLMITQASSESSVTGQDKRAKFQTSKPHISADFHSFRLIFGRAIIPWNSLEAWMLFPGRARGTLTLKRR
jgi:aspartokinase